MSKSVMVLAGELSGDMHAAHVVRAAKALAPEVHFFGIGGDNLRAEGMEILVDAREMAVLGLAEVLRRYPFFKKVFARMLAVARERKPDAVLLIDYPGFNLRFAAEAKKEGVKVVYYVCPQVWAWNRGRIPKMAAIVDRLMVIFPFEVDVFAGTGLRVDFVGHPLVDETRKALFQPLEQLPWHGTPQIALLPGSRKQEMERLFPVMWQAAALLEKQYPQASFILAAASPQMERMAKDMMARFAPGPARFFIVTGATRQVLRQAKAAMVASGTATVETALMGCPMAVVYKTAWLTYHIGRMVVKVPHLGMVNLLAGRELCPELIQQAATPEALAEVMAPLLADSPARAAQLKGLEEVCLKLGNGGAAENAARILVQELG